MGLKGLEWGISLYFNDFIIIFNILMLSNVSKKCGENVMLRNNYNGETCCW